METRRAFVISTRSKATMLTLVVLVLQIMLSHQQATGPKACDNNICVCNGGSIRCVGQSSLMAVPSEIPTIATDLTIIQTGLQRIEERDFVGLEDLSVLYLQQNKIYYIHPLAFKNLFRLDILSLEDNALLGTLDPVMFQHLPNLYILILQRNDLNHMNKYTFLTSISQPNTRMEVRLYDNYIECDCDVLALKNWMNNLVGLGNPIAISNLACVNDASRRTFDVVPTNVFGSCGVTECYNTTVSNETYPTVNTTAAYDDILDQLNDWIFSQEPDPYLVGSTRPPTSTTITGAIRITGSCGDKDSDSDGNGSDDCDDSEDSGNEERDYSDDHYVDEALEAKKHEICAIEADIFATTYTCPYCSGERTNYACNQQQRQTCMSNQVCRKKIEWFPSTGNFSINSFCDFYSDCLIAEGRNSDTCGVRYQSSGIVECTFCCAGPTCLDETIGGRTRDFTYYLNYVRGSGPYKAYMDNPSSSEYRYEADRISSGLQRDITGDKYGVDVFVYSYAPVSSSDHNVTLRIEVTTFTTETLTTITSQLEQRLGLSISSPSGFLYLEAVSSKTILLTTNDLSGGYDPVITDPDSTPSPITTADPLPTCPRETTETEAGAITWAATGVDTTQNQACPIERADGTTVYASRRCTLDGSGYEALWGPVEDGDCPTPSTVVDEKIEEINENGIDSGNAEQVAQELEVITEAQLTAQQVEEVVSLLEQLVEPSNIQQEGVPEKVMQSVNNLLEVDAEVLDTAQEEDRSAEKILGVVNTVADTAPLVEGKLEVVTPNLAVAAQEISSTETRDVTLLAGDESASNDRLDNNQISVDLTNKGQDVRTDITSLVLPIAAISSSLGQADKAKIERASFVVFASDKLFEVIQEPDSQQQQSSINVNDGSDGDNIVDNDGEAPPRYVVQINSMVISASVPGVTVQNLNENITMTFTHKSKNATNPRCVFWDEAINDWSSEGCGIVTSTSGVTTCGCDHLTNFALLMDVYGEGTGLSSLDKKVLSYISYIGCGISLAALLLTLLTYALFRKLRRDNPSKILINLCLALLLSNLVYLAGMQDYTFDNDTACKVVAVLLHYLLLASLTWMVVEAFYMYLALILVFKTYFTNFILKCCLVGWGVPLVIVAITLGVDTTDNYGFISSGMCWLKNPAFYAAFVGPVCVILLINFIAFGMVIKKLSGLHSSKLTKSDRNSTTQRLRGAIGVVILLGLTWIFAVFAIGEASKVFYYLFAIFNSLQGLFIFIFYCLMKKDAITAWKRALPCFEEYGETSKSSSNSKGISQTGFQQYPTSTTNNRTRPSSASSTVKGTSSSGTMDTSLSNDSRKNSLNVVGNGNGNLYSTIDDKDVYTNLNSDGTQRELKGYDNPVMNFPDPDYAGRAYDKATSPYERNYNVPENRHNNHVARPPAPYYAPPLSFQGQRQQGEVDHSNMARVRDIKLKFETDNS